MSIFCVKAGVNRRKRRRKNAGKGIMVAGQNLLFPGCARSSFLVKVILEAKQSCGKLRR